MNMDKVNFFFFEKLFYFRPFRDIEGSLCIYNMAFYIRLS